MRIVRLIAPAILVLALVAASGCIPMCVARGTRVETPGGPVSVEALVVGDEVMSVNPRTGERVTGRIAVIRSARRRVLRVTAANGNRIEATAAHPFLGAGGGYVPLGRLHRESAPRVVVLHDGGLLDELVSVEDERATRAVYDLTVDSPFHNFVAEGFVVHNKPNPNTPYVSGPVLDLAAVDSTSATATLAWSAPDGYDGPPDEYRITVVTEQGPTRTRVIAVTLPASGSGVRMTYMIEQLAPATKYVATLVSKHSSRGLWSRPSNEARFSTLAATSPRGE